MQILKMIDTFCGLGGSSEGFAEEGFDCTGIDIVNVGYPYRFIQADMLELDGHDFQGYDVIWGSPPCRDFTILNDARWKIKKDPQRGLKLVNCFLQFVKDAKPTFWIMENVFGLEKYLPTPKISKARIGYKKHVFYGNFPPFLLPQTTTFKLRESSGWPKLAKWKRAKIPKACSQAFAKVCKTHLT